MDFKKSAQELFVTCPNCQGEGMEGHVNAACHMCLGEGSLWPTCNDIESLIQSVFTAGKLEGVTEQIDMLHRMMDENAYEMALPNVKPEIFNLCENENIILTQIIKAIRQSIQENGETLDK